MKHKVTQRQFDILMKAAKALDKQGVRSADEVGNCFYRGPKRRKCIIGQMIPDNLYEPDMEGHSCGEGDDIFNGAIEGFEGEVPLGLLSDLQRHHDWVHLWESQRQTNPNAMQDYVKKIVEVV